MAEGTVNSQIIDSMTQAIAAVVGNSSAETKGMLDTLMAETVGMAMYNAVTNQHNAQMVSNASLTAACARMLKAPFAAPLAAKLSMPVVLSLSPNPIPLSTASQRIQVSGSGFQPGLNVDLFDAGGSKLASLSGNMQLADITGTSFAMIANVFITEGAYSIQVRNPDGGTSILLPIQVQAQPPSVTAVTKASDNIFQVTGTDFQSSLTAAVVDHAGNPIQGASVVGVTATGFTLNLPTGMTTGPYGLIVTNPDGRKSPLFLFM